PSIRSTHFFRCLGRIKAATVKLLLLYPICAAAFRFTWDRGFFLDSRESRRPTLLLSQNYRVTFTSCSAQTPRVIRCHQRLGEASTISGRKLRRIPIRPPIRTLQ